MEWRQSVNLSNTFSQFNPDWDPHLGILVSGSRLGHYSIRFIKFEAASFLSTAKWEPISESEANGNTGAVGTAPNPPNYYYYCYFHFNWIGLDF